MKRLEEDGSEKATNLTKHGPASDEVHRIIPLGFTLGEARAWYVNRVLMPRLRWGLAALVTGFIILLPVTTDLGQLFEQSPMTHMIAHDSLLLIAGFLFAYAFNSLVGVTFRLSDRLWRVRTVLSRSDVSGKAFSVSTFGFAHWVLVPPRPV
jgi:hypothetical protein